MAEKDGLIEMDGKVVKAEANAIFFVELENGSVIVCHTAGKLRKNKIKILPGDRVKVELSVYDLTKGRISFRY